jgi:site-specific recombinase XerC
MPRPRQDRGRLIMRDHSLLGPWVRRFLLEYLVTERNLARNTQVSYRDTLIQLLPFVSRLAAVPIDRLTVHDISADRVRLFLDHIESERGCSGVTRNLRLSAIHSLARFVGMRSPEHLDWCSQIRSVSLKKVARRSSATSTSQKWRLCCALRIAARVWVREIMRCFSFSTTAALALMRRRLCE